MEHALHLGAGHFIKVVSPTSRHSFANKINNDDDKLGDNSDSSEVEFSVGDTIGKSLALVNQVSIVTTV
jgi:hypothetical protein